jgi:hypothetical protein
VNISVDVSVKVGTDGSEDGPEDGTTGGAEPEGGDVGDSSVHGVVNISVDVSVTVVGCNEGKDITGDDTVEMSGVDDPGGG